MHLSPTLFVRSVVSIKFLLMYVFNQPQLFDQNREGKKTITSSNSCPKFRGGAVKVLDAPYLIDDYYLSVLDWSSKNILGVGLNTSLYMWNARDGAVDLLLEDEDQRNTITSVKFSDNGDIVAIGFTDNKVQLWDVETQKFLRELPGHSARVCSLAWNDNVISTGGRYPLFWL